ncbi:MAG: helix-turn-helix transcriptional regulator [Saccharofermentanales bacterium]
MEEELVLLTQIADGLVKQFGHDCEVVIHDLTASDTAYSISYIENGHVTGRQAGDGPSKVVLETLHRNHSSIRDHAGYLTRTADGRILKSSTLYIRGEDQKVRYIFSINYDITGLMSASKALESFIETEPPDGRLKPDMIVSNVHDLLDSLIDQSMALAGKPVALMTKDEKVAAIRFLNDAGAFLITRSGEKVARHFGISKYTLYSYIDVNK